MLLLFAYILIFPILFDKTSEQYFCGDTVSCWSSAQGSMKHPSRISSQYLGKKIFISDLVWINALLKMDANLNKRKRMISEIAIYTIFHNFYEKFTCLTLFVILIFFHFLICALVQLFPVGKNTHPKALLLNKFPEHLIGYTVWNDFQISMLYHSTFHGSIL